jgi:hypothetical protein
VIIRPCCWNTPEYRLAGSWLCREIWLFMIGS